MEVNKISLAKLGNDNYEAWSYKMKMFLLREDLSDVITGVAPAATEAAALAAWKKRDGKALATIALSVEDSQVSLIKKKTTAKEAWEALQEYHQKNTLSNKVSLLEKICLTRLEEGGDMEKHIYVMEEMFEKLSVLGRDLEEDFRVALILSSLPDSYSVLTTALEARPEKDLTLTVVKNKLMEEYQKKGSKQHEEHNDDKALKASGGKQLKNPMKDDTITCNFCKKQGHIKKRCFKWLAQQKGGAENQKDGHEARKVTERSSDFAFRSSQDHSDQDLWCIDSGATSHMSSNRKFFTSFKSFKKEIYLADGKIMHASGIGNGVFIGVNDSGKSVSLTFTDVLFVPALKGNLLSVRRLADKGFHVDFKNDGCKVMRDNMVVVVGEVCGSGLYHLMPFESADDDISRDTRW
jgi:hypothetical protein